MYGTDDDRKRQEEIVKRIKDDYPELDNHLDLLQTVFPVFSSYGPRSINGDHNRKSIADKFYFENYFSMTVSEDKLSFDKYHTYLDLLINEIELFKNELKRLNSDKIQQFFKMYEAHTSDNITDDLRMKVIHNIVYSIGQKNDRDFRKDKTYADFAWSSTSWSDVVAEEVVKLRKHQEALSILEKIKTWELNIVVY